MPHFRTTDGLNLHYSDAGSGQPVLCLAGLTRNGRDFDFLVPHLRDVRLLRLDTRGRGQSDHDPEFRHYNIFHEAADAIALLDHLGLPRATLIGTSRGGLIAMALALRHKHRLAGVVLNDIGPVIDTGGLARIMEYVGIEPGLPDLDAAARALQKAGAAEFPGVPLDRWRAHADNMWYEKPGGGLGIRYDSHLRDALIAQSENAAPAHLWDWFEALAGLPVGVIRGANSDLLSAQTVQEMAARHPGLIHATVPDRAHVPFLDEPESLDVIRKTLEQTA